MVFLLARMPYDAGGVVSMCNTACIDLHSMHERLFMWHCHEPDTLEVSKGIGGAP